MCQWFMFMLGDEDEDEDEEDEDDESEFDVGFALVSWCNWLMLLPLGVEAACGAVSRAPGPCGANRSCCGPFCNPYGLLAGG